MPDNRTEVPWKRFEAIAYRIEKYLSPHGAVATLNDSIKDLKTGSMRQIDASIRYRIGSVEMLITIECRRHSDPQDATWIEQLAKKRENIGANATIAVASEGFYKTAGALAAYENVYPRTLAQLEKPQDLDWLQLQFNHAVVRTYSLRRLGLELYDPKEDDRIEYDETILASCPSRIHYPLFIHVKTGKRYDYNEPIRLSELQGADWFEGNELGADVVRNLKWECHDRGLVVETNNGPKDVKTIYVEFSTRLDRHELPTESVFKYSDKDTNILEGAEFDLGDVLEGQSLRIYRTDEGIRFGISPKERDER